MIMNRRVKQLREDVWNKSNAIDIRSQIMFHHCIHTRENKTCIFVVEWYCWCLYYLTFTGHLLSCICLSVYMYIYIYMHTCMHTYMHACWLDIYVLPTYIHACMHACNIYMTKWDHFLPWPEKMFNLPQIKWGFQYMENLQLIVNNGATVYAIVNDRLSALELAITADMGHDGWASDVALSNIHERSLFTFI